MDKQKVSPLEKDWTHCGMIVKVLVHPSPRGETPYIQDGGKGGKPPSLPTATGPQVVGLKRSTGAELRSVQDRVAVHSELLEVIGVSG